MTTKPLIIYHDNCADGFGAAWAAYRKFGADGAEYLPMNYNDPRVSAILCTLTFPVNVVGRDVYILDFSFSADVMYALADRAKKVFWRDHHKTAFEVFDFDPTQVHAFVDDKTDTILHPHKSGCVLAWELFHPVLAVPKMLLLIQDRDLWKWKLDDTRHFATALRSRPFSFNWFDEASCSTDKMVVEGAAMNRLFDQQLADIITRPVPVRLIAYDGLAVNCTPQFSSEGGNELAKKSGTFGMTWCVGENGQVFVSLRSIGDYDVSAIAKQFGGGGHRNAAGLKTTFDKLHFNEKGGLEIMK